MTRKKRCSCNRSICLISYCMCRCAYVSFNSFALLWFLWLSDFIFFQSSLYFLYFFRCNFAIFVFFLFIPSLLVDTIFKNKTKKTNRKKYILRSKHLKPISYFFHFDMYESNKTKIVKLRRGNQQGVNQIITYCFLMLNFMFYQSLWENVIKNLFLLSWEL